MSRLTSLMQGKCPSCNDAYLFEQPWWKISQFSKMHKSCPKCGVKFEREPGFFYGAMYLSYAFSIAIMVIGGFIIYYLFDNPSPSYFVVPITIFSLLFTPFNFRISRVLYLYLFSGIRSKNE